MSSESLARQHLQIAVQLMGAPWVAAQAQAQAQAQPPPSNRGRKAGQVPEPDRRCAWHPEGRDQCRNSRSGDEAYCKIHLQNVILLPQ